MGRLLEFRGYNISNNIWDDDEVVCQEAASENYSGFLCDIFSDLAIKESTMDDNSLYASCQELMCFSNKNAVQIDTTENTTVAEILKSVAYEYYIHLLYDNTNNIIYNICVTHVNNTLIENENLNYSEEDLEEFLEDDYFDVESFKDNILKELTNHILEKNISDVNMDDLTSRIDDLTDKIENFINDLDCEEEDLDIDFFCQRISENKVCISIEISNEN